MAVRKHTTRFLAACLLSALSATSGAINTGRELRDDCEIFARHYGGQGGNPLLFQQATKCLIYSAGVIDGFRLAVWDGAELPFCLPPEVGYNHLGLVVHKYLSAHPEELDQPSAILIRSAVISAFPCEK
jgi:hypothetical protein